VYAEGKGQFRSIAKMSVRANILNMSKIYDRTISQSAIMLFMNHQGPLEAPSMVACFHHKIPTGFMMLLDYYVYARLRKLMQRLTRLKTVIILQRYKPLA